MKMVQSTDTAAVLLNAWIDDADFYLGDHAEDENAVAVDSIKAISTAPEVYRDSLLSRRNQAIQALNELGIKHDHAPETTNIGPSAS